MFKFGIMLGNVSIETVFFTSKIWEYISGFHWAWKWLRITKKVFKTAIILQNCNFYTIQDSNLEIQSTQQIFYNLLWKFKIRGKNYRSVQTTISVVWKIHLYSKFLTWWVSEENFADSTRLTLPTFVHFSDVQKVSQDFLVLALYELRHL